MELFNKKNLAIGSAIFSAVYSASVVIGGLGVDVVVSEPKECRLIQELNPVRYADNRFFKSLVQKKRAKELGADTLYLPISVTNVVSSTGYMNGAAYDCTTKGIVSQY